MCGVGRKRERGLLLAALILLIVCFVLFLILCILLFGLVWFGFCRHFTYLVIAPNPILVLYKITVVWCFATLLFEP